MTSISNSIVLGVMEKLEIAPCTDGGEGSIASTARVKFESAVRAMRLIWAPSELADNTELAVLSALIRAVICELT